MRRVLSKLKELLCVESSYLMVKPLKQCPYHPNIGRKSGTDLPRPSIGLHTIHNGIQLLVNLPPDHDRVFDWCIDIPAKIISF